MDDYEIEQAARETARQSHRRDAYSGFDAIDHAKEWLYENHSHEVSVFSDAYDDETRRIVAEQGKAGDQL